MHILISPNAFKSSLDAGSVADAIEMGLQSSRLHFTSEKIPVGDGGDGTGELLIKQSNGIHITGRVHNALGSIIDSSFGLIDNQDTAVIEMANAAGIRLLERATLNPLKASSYGTGEQVKAALDKGVKKIIIGMGGSATVDGGAGILHALGVRFLNASGEELFPNPENLAALNEIDTSKLDKRIPGTEIIVMCDVQNKLLGDKGAARVFGPQKGATAEGLIILEKYLTQFATIIHRNTGKKVDDINGGGTAGGAAAGLFAFLNAQLVNGIDYYLDRVGFENALSKADLVITAEGSIDEQSLEGKAPFGVALRAKVKGIPVVGMAGKVPLNTDQKLNRYFDVLLSIANEPSPLTDALKHTHQNLVRLAGQLGNLLTLNT
ncbi:glycerate kinase [Asinibacterium sp. OR53]|uniref:glycerate kinase n=1 Tax=Asinibacterium sp. OR53 TaxID=925409 RepID=UPI00047B16EB|nr:glycerate kinase [Asinibacterium sp. OR53]